MLIREYQSSDCKELAELFYDTVHRVNARDNTKGQLDAWATGNAPHDACGRGRSPGTAAGLYRHPAKMQGAGSGGAGGDKANCGGYRQIMGKKGKHTSAAVKSIMSFPGPAGQRRASAHTAL